MAKRSHDGTKNTEREDRQFRDRLGIRHDPSTIVQPEWFLPDLGFPERETEEPADFSGLGWGATHGIAMQQTLWLALLPCTASAFLAGHVTASRSVPLPSVPSPAAARIRMLGPDVDSKKTATAGMVGKVQPTGRAPSSTTESILSLESEPYMLGPELPLPLEQRAPEAPVTDVILRSAILITWLWVGVAEVLLTCAA